MTDFLPVLAVLAVLPTALILAWKTEALNRGKPLPQMGRLNKLAWRWHRWIVRQRANTEPRRQRDERIAPDRTPAEVDSIRREARRARVAAESNDVPAGQEFPVRVVARLTRSVRYDPNRPPCDEGYFVSFEYVDAEGTVTDREIRNWTIEDGYLLGLCTMRRATRQFRLDRVLTWRRWE